MAFLTATFPTSLPAPSITATANASARNGRRLNIRVSPQFGTKYSPASHYTMKLVFNPEICSCPTKNALELTPKAFFPIHNKPLPLGFGFLLQIYPSPKPPRFAPTRRLGTVAPQFPC